MRKTRLKRVTEWLLKLLQIDPVIYHTSIADILISPTTATILYAIL